MQKKKHMKNSDQTHPSLYKKNFFLLIQFFLIIFVYHTLKDLKDTVVITGSSVGAEVIPFIKIWGMLPLAIGASYLFSVIYNRFGREKTLHIFICLLLFFYLIFAFVLYPLREYQPITKLFMKTKKKRAVGSFRDNILSIFKSGPLLCIAILVIGFGLTRNLSEVVWKESIRVLHPEPRDYNAYINQLTSLIGIFAVLTAFLSRWIFQLFSWKKIALITPVTLFITSLIFFLLLLLPSEYLSSFSANLNMSPLFLIVTAGSIHYLLSMTAKYTIFDTCKEMAFLSIDLEGRMKAKSVIDSLGARFGKTGASCLYQFLLIAFGSTSSHLSIIGVASLIMIGVSIAATKRLGLYLSEKVQEEKCLGS